MILTNKKWRWWGCIALLVVIFSCCHGMGQAAIPAKPSAGTYVVDQAQVLSETTKQTINAMAAELDEKTSAQVAVVTVDSLDGHTADDYALSILRDWGVGTKKDNNGLVFLLAPKDKRVYISVGYGLEGILNDAKAGQIIDDYGLALFKNNKFDAGTLAVSKVLMSVIAQDKGIDLTGHVKVNKKYMASSQKQPLSIWELLIGGLVLGCLVVVDFKFFGGTITYLIISLILSGRGGGSNRGSGRGFGGGSGGGGGAGRGW